MTRFLLSLALACTLCSAAYTQTTCTYTLAMFDAFNDGWTGGKVTLLNGSQSFSLDLPEGSADTVAVQVTAGAALSLSWSAGSFPEDVTFVLYDNLGDTLYASTQPLQEGILYSDTARCYTCPVPRHVRIENVYDTRAKFRWSVGGSGTVQDWLVIYGPEGFHIGSPDSDTLITTTPKATVTGLLKKTAYDAYIVQRCDATSLSRPVGPLRFLTYYSNDAGISAVLTPQSACEVGLSSVTVRISNYGANPLSLIPFRYNVNGKDAGVIQPQDGLYTGVLGKDSSDVIEFDLRYSFDDPIEYEIAAFTELPGDEDKSNDTLYYYLNNRLQPDYLQQFEKWDGGWIVDSSSLEPTWQHGILSKAKLPQAYSGHQAWATNLSGRINAGESSGLFSPCFNFAEATADPAIEFRFFHDLLEEEFSGAWMEYSFDGKLWQHLGKKDQGINWYNITNTQTSLGDVWAGSTEGWTLSRLILKGMKGKEEVHFRFRTDAFFFEEGEGVAFDDFRIYVPKAKDLGALQLSTLGDAAACGLEKDYVRLQFANLGTDSLSVYSAAYSLNGQPPVIEPINLKIKPDGTATHTFSTAFDSRDEQFSIRVWVQLSGDQYTANDTITHSIDHRPLPVPMQENFEGSGEPPAGWVTTASVSSGHGNSSRVLAEQFASFNTNFETLLPRYGTIEAGDSLYFDYRIVSNDGQTPLQLLSTTRIEVQVSGDCGDNFKTLYTINSSSHTPSLNLRSIGIPLGDFASRSVFIRFKGTWAAGSYYFDLDNFNLRACPPDMLLSATTKGATAGQSNGSATITVGLGNPPYTYAWSNGTTTQQATLEGLPIGIYIVTVTDSRGCAGKFEVPIGINAVRDIASLLALRLSPNPTDGLTLLQADFSEPVDGDLQMLDLLGRPLLSQSFSATTSLSQTLDLQQYPAGLYLLRLRVGNTVSVRRLVKQ